MKRNKYISLLSMAAVCRQFSLSSGKLTLILHKYTFGLQVFPIKNLEQKKKNLEQIGISLIYICNIRSFCLLFDSKKKWFIMNPHYTYNPRSRNLHLAASQFVTYTCKILDNCLFFPRRFQRKKVTLLSFVNFYSRYTYLSLFSL